MTVVALRALGLGDLLAAVPALRALRRAVGREALHLGTSPPLAAFAGDLRLADVVIPTSSPRLPVERLPRGSMAVNLHGRGPESTRALLALEPARLVAFAHPDIPVTWGSPPWQETEHERVRWCRLLTEEGIPADPEEFRLDPPRDAGRVLEAAAIPLSPRHGRIVIHPGAASPARRWPADRWAEVAGSLHRDGADIVLTGSLAERPLALSIARAAGLRDTDVVAGMTDISSLASVVAGASLFLSSDTGPAHLAVAYGTPSVVLFGPTPPAEWGPPPDPRHIALWAGARGDPHGRTPDPGLLRIDTASVLDAVARI